MRKKKKKTLPKMIQKFTDISVLFVLTTKFFLIINLVSVVYKKKRYLLLTRSNHRRGFLLGN